MKKRLPENRSKTLSELRRSICKRSITPVKLYIATIELTFHPECTLSDLLACVKRGGPGATIASGVLHNRTGRPRRLSKWIKDADDWRCYLQSKGLLKQTSSLMSRTTKRSKKRPLSTTAN
jgi:hypothetical protein